MCRYIWHFQKHPQSVITDFMAQSFRCLFIRNRTVLQLFDLFHIVPARILCRCPLEQHCCQGNEPAVWCGHMQARSQTLAALAAELWQNLHSNHTWSIYTEASNIPLSACLRCLPMGASLGRSFTIRLELEWSSHSLPRCSKSYWEKRCRYSFPFLVTLQVAWSCSVTSIDGALWAIWLRHVKAMQLFFSSRHSLRVAHVQVWACVHLCHAFEY